MTKLKAAGEKRIINYVNGALIYYGLIRVEEMHELAVENLDVDLKCKTLEKIFEKALGGEDHQYLFEFYDGILCADTIGDPVSIYKEQNSRVEITIKPLEKRKPGLPYACI